MEYDSKRAQNELDHGRWLASSGPEKMWGWDTSAGRTRASRRARLLTEGALLEPGKTALEIGCGTGLFTEQFATTGVNLVAVDISGDLLQRAKARSFPKGNVTFLEKRFEDCTLNGPFDAVIGSSVLHHLDTAEALPKIRDLLKPGGRLTLVEPNLLNPQVWLERALPRFFPYVSPDEIAFLRWSLRTELLATGFTDVRIIPVDWLHPATPSPLVDVVQRIGRFLEVVPLVREFAGSLYIRACREA